MSKKARTLEPGQVVDNKTVRSDEDVMLGHFCTITAGEHAGTYAVFESVSTTDEDGYPFKVVVVTRDDNHQRLEVMYSSLERARSGQR